MTNARSIINRAARKIGVLGRGQPLPAEEAESALEELNSFLKTLSADVATIFNDTKESFTLNGSRSYTIGSGGDFDTTMPISIQSMFIRDAGGGDYNLMQLNVEQYADIMQKGNIGRPSAFFYEKGTPLGTIYLYPVGGSGYTLHIWSNKAISSFADLTTDYNLVEGVDDMLVYNLAMRLSPDYEKEPTPFIKEMARNTKLAVEGNVRRNNYPVSSRGVSERSSGNIYGGWER